MNRCVILTVEYMDIITVAMEVNKYPSRNTENAAPTNVPLNLFQNKFT
jgi:hypothetical protein